MKKLLLTVLLGLSINLLPAAERKFLAVRDMHVPQSEEDDMPSCDIFLICSSCGGYKAYNLTETKDIDEQVAAFSHDGKKVFYVSEGNLMEMTSEGENKKKISENQFKDLWINSIAADPSGNSLALSAWIDSAPYYGIWIFNLNDKSVRRIAEKEELGGSVRFSPDGKKLLLSNNGIIKLIDIATGTVNDLLNDFNARRDYSDASFSSDGKKIVYAAQWEEHGQNGFMGHRYEICTADSDGNNKKTIIKKDFYLMSPFFNKTGSKIYYSAGAPDQICFINADGTGEKQLTDYKDFYGICDFVDL